MVYVQVSQKDVVHFRDWDAHGKNVLGAPGSEVKEKAAAVAQLNHDGCAGLIAPQRIGATTNKRDPHLVGPEGFTAREVIHPASDRWRWLVIRRELQAGARPSAIGIHGRNLVAVVSCHW